MGVNFFGGRDDDDVKFAPGSRGAIPVDVLYIRTRVELEEAFTDHAVVVEHEEDAPATDSGVFSDNLHVVYLMVGEVIDGMGIDREVKAVIATLFIDEDVLARGIREGEEV